MATTVTETIGAAGDYTSVTAWEAATDNNLVTADEIRVGEIQDEVVVESAQITIAGATVDATRFRRLTAAVEHAGARATGARISFNNGAGCLRVDENFARVEGLALIASVAMSPTNFALLDVNAPTGTRQGVALARCLVYDVSFATGAGVMWVILVRSVSTSPTLEASVVNCVVLNCTGNRSDDTTVAGIRAEAGRTAGGCVLRVVNCTVLNVANTGAGNGNGFQLQLSNGNTLQAENNAAAGHDVDFLWAIGTGTLTTNNNASEDATADDQGGSDHVTGLTPGDTFVSVTGGSEDPHLKAGSVLRTAGKDLSAVPLAAIDLDGQTRPSTWDTGADQATFDLVLTVHDAGVALAADAPALTQAHVLAIQEATTALTPESPGLVQANVLAVAEALVALAPESPILAQANVLAVAEALVAVVPDSPALLQANALAVQGADVGLTAEHVTLSLATLLAVADAAVAVVVGQVVLTQQHQLVVAEALLGLAADQLGLVQAHVLTVGDAVVALVVDQVVLLLPSTFTTARLANLSLAGPVAAGVALTGPRVAGAVLTGPRLTSLTLE